MPPKSSNASLIFDQNELRKRNPWDQIAGESDKAFKAFMIYRNLPVEERTVRNAWKQYSPDRSDQQYSAHFANWSKLNHWRERASAWDRHLQGIKDKATEKVFSKELVEERKNRQKILDGMRTLVGQYMVWVQATEKNATKLRSVTASAAIYLEQSRREFGDDPSNERQREEQLQENMESVRQKIQSIMVEAAAEGETGGDSQFVQ